MRTLRFLARRRSAGRLLPRWQPQSSASSACPRSQAAAGAPGPNVPSDPPTWSPLQPAPSALPPQERLTLTRGDMGPPNMGASASSSKAEAFPCGDAGSPGGAAPGSGPASRKALEAGGVARARGAAQELRLPGLAAARPGHLAARPLLSLGRLRLFNTSYSTGAPRIIFTADLQVQGRPRQGGGRGLPELPSHVCRQGNLCRFSPPGPNAAGGRSGGAQHLPAVLPPPGRLEQLPVRGSAAGRCQPPRPEISSPPTTRK